MVKPAWLTLQSRELEQDVKFIAIIVFLNRWCVPSCKQKNEQMNER